MTFLSDCLNKSVSDWIFLILIFVGGLLLLQALRSWYRLRHFKGPLFAAFSRIWLVRRLRGGRLHLDFQEVNQKYGLFDDWDGHD
jgi:hypothetical protein